MLYGLEDPTWEYVLGFQKCEDEKLFNWPLMGGPIMLEKPLKRVSRPNADVRLSNLVGEIYRRMKYVGEKASKIWDWIMKDMLDLIT